MARYFHDQDGEREFNISLVLSAIKIGMLLWVGVLALGIAAIEYFFPAFFNYPAWRWTLDWADVMKFWPLFAVGVGWTLVSSFWSERTSYAGKILVAETVGYGLTGLWEELMYRWAIIPYVMIGVWVTNVFWSVAVGYIIGIAAGIAGMYFLLQAREGVANLMLAVIALAVSGMAFWYGSTADPIYWLMTHVFIPVANFTTAGYMGEMLTAPRDPLFLFGILLANSAFRDGHKYQGLTGIVNSWYVGMVLIYATLTYGILTAIVVHAIYDIIFAVMKYVGRKIVG